MRPGRQRATSTPSPTATPTAHARSGWSRPCSSCSSTPARSARRRDSEEASKFIDEEISCYEAKLVEAENRLKEFKLRNFGVDRVSHPGLLRAHVGAVRRGRRLRLELSAAEQSRDAYRRELSGENPQLPGDNGGRAADPAVRTGHPHREPEEEARRDAPPLHRRASRRDQHPAHHRPGRGAAPARSRGEGGRDRIGEGRGRSPPPARCSRRCASRLPRPRPSRLAARRDWASSRRGSKRPGRWPAAYRRSKPSWPS